MGLARVLSLLVYFSALLVATVASPVDVLEQSHELSRRGTIPHNQVKGFSQAVGSGVTATLYLKYKPVLRVINGCVPFPAVDKNGNTSGGLKNSGAMNGKCSKSPGQIYVRSASRKGHFAIMYAWYFPKDQNVDGPGNRGHRHDWEHVVVWLSGKSTSAKVLGVSYSGHGKYTKESKRGGGNRFANTSHVKVGYMNYGSLNHSLRPDSGNGGSQPLINWSQLPTAAKKALQKDLFGKAIVPFQDKNINSNIDASWSSSYKP